VNAEEVDGHRVLVIPSECEGSAVGERVDNGRGAAARYHSLAVVAQKSLLNRAREQAEQSANF